MEDGCEICCGMRGHEILKESIRKEMRVELKRASDEYDRLKKLVGEVMWFNFEVRARDWKYPWPETNLESEVTLHGVRFREVQYEGRTATYEKCEWPVYYSGPVEQAPEIPVNVLYNWRV